MASGFQHVDGKNEMEKPESSDDATIHADGSHIEHATKDVEQAEVKQSQRRVGNVREGHGHEKVVTRDVPTLMEKIRRRKDENRGLKKELEQRKNELRERETTQKEIEEQLSCVVQMLESRTSQLNASREEIGRRKDETTSLRKELMHRKDENISLAKELEQRKNELQGRESVQEGLQRSLDSTLQLLETRTLELRAAQTFLSTEDSRSIADVVQLVHDLNSEIVQASASLADSLSFEVIPDIDEDTIAKADQKVFQLMGPLALGLLRSVKGEEDMELLEAVFRGCIVGRAYDIIASWHFRPDFSPASLELDGLYEKIYSQEEQAVAGTWRALTRRNLQRALHGDSDIPKDLSRYIAKTGLSDAIMCAKLSLNRKDTEKLVMKNIGSKLESVAALAHKLNRIIGEELTSTDLKVTWAHPNAGYNPSIMDDANAEGNQHKPVKVDIICTMELGLSARLKGPDGKPKDKIILKPKVVLEGFLDPEK